MDNIKHISEILGYGNEIKTYHQLDNRVKQGLPKDAFNRVMNAIFLKKEEASRFSLEIVPRGSRKQKLLTEYQSERIARLARIYTKTVEVFAGNKD